MSNNTAKKNVSEVQENGSKLLIDTVKRHWNSVDIPETLRALNNVFFSWVAAADWEHNYRSANSSEFHNLIEFLIDIEPMLAAIESDESDITEVECTEVNKSTQIEDEKKVSIEITQHGWHVAVKSNGTEANQTYLVSDGEPVMAESNLGSRHIDSAIVNLLRKTDFSDIVKALNEQSTSIN